MPSTALNCLSKRLKGWKSCVSSSLFKPFPVSFTLILNVSSFWLQSIVTVPPFLLYLIALDNKLIKICFKRVLSAKIWCWQSSVLSCKSTSYCSACCCNKSLHSCMICLISIGSKIKFCCPDSICAKSNISLTSSSKCQPPCSICATLRCCSSEIAGWLICNNCANPNIAFNGVRNSWLMRDKNSDFAELAVSADNFASCNSILLV